MFRFWHLAASVFVRFWRLADIGLCTAHVRLSGVKPDMNWHRIRNPFLNAAVGCYDARQSLGRNCRRREFIK